MTMPKVLTILLNWRTAAMTIQAAEAALTALRGMDGALVIVDNDSGDGSFEAIQSHADASGWSTAVPPVRVLQAGRNGGYGAGNNFGMRALMPDGTEPDFVYVLNSDAFPEPDAIRLLLDHLQAHPKSGIAGSLIYGPDGEEQRAAFRFPSIPAEFEAQIRLGLVSRILQRHIVAFPVPSVTTQVDWVAGAGLMLRQAMLDQIGGFDETFFLYFEETDLCRRAARAGWATDFVRESRVLHLGSVSTGQGGWDRVPHYWLDSRLHYFTKNHGGLYAAAATLSHLAGGLLWQVRRLLQRKDRLDPPHYLWDMSCHALAACWQGLTGARSTNQPRAAQGDE